MESIPSRHSPAPANELVVPTSRLRLFGLVVASVVMIAVSAWVATLDIGLVRRGAAQVGVVFFGFGFFYAIWRLVRPRPALVINDEGIVDNASAIAVGLIRWSEIARLVEYDIAGQKMLGIVPTDLEAVLVRLPKWKQRLLRANSGLDFAPINIPRMALSMSIEELRGEIARRFGR